jgi:DNA-binding HxlR family transcriptional regulator
MQALGASPGGPNFTLYSLGMIGKQLGFPLVVGTQGRSGMETNQTCPVCQTAEIISGKWTLLIIRDLAEGRCRFCELERSLQGISPRTLSLRLRALESEGVIERRTYPEVPPRVEYRLTRKGEALVPLIEHMRSYGTRWLLNGVPPGSEAPVRLRAKADGTERETRAA